MATPGFNRCLINMKFNDFISQKQIISWGMLHQIEREQLVDSYLSEVTYPKEDDKKNIKAEWIKRQKITSEKALKDWQVANGLTNNEWEELLVRKWRWNYWCKNFFRGKIKSYYLERKSMLDQVSYSLIRVKDENLASEIYLRIKEGEEDFGDLAAKYSEGSEKNTYGRIGPVSFDKSHPVLSRLLQVSQENQLWAPRNIDSWWVIIKLEKSHQTVLSEEISSLLSLELGEKHLNEVLHSGRKKLHKNNYQRI